MITRFIAHLNVAYDLLHQASPKTRKQIQTLKTYSGHSGWTWWCLLHPSATFPKTDHLWDMPQRTRQVARQNASSKLSSVFITSTILNSLLHFSHYFKSLKSYHSSVLPSLCYAQLPFFARFKLCTALLLITKLNC